MSLDAHPQRAEESEKKSETADSFLPASLRQHMRAKMQGVMQSVPPPPPPAPSRKHLSPPPLPKRASNAISAPLSFKQSLEAVRTAGKTYIHTNVLDERTGLYAGYKTYGSPNATDAKRIEHPGGVDPGVLKKIIEADFGSKTDASSMESVRLTESRNGEKFLVYTFCAPKALDRSNRPGAIFKVGIALPADKARTIFAYLETHPEEARSFFRAAGQDVERADHLWSACEPPYKATDSDRKLLLAEQRGPGEQGPALRLSFLQPTPQGWSKRMPEPALHALMEKAKTEADERRVRHARYLERQANPVQPQPKKNFWSRLFG